MATKTGRLSGVIWLCLLSAKRMPIRAVQVAKYRDLFRAHVGISF